MVVVFIAHSGLVCSRSCCVVLLSGLELTQCSGMFILSGAIKYGFVVVLIPKFGMLWQ